MLNQKTIVFLLSFILFNTAIRAQILFSNVRIYGTLNVPAEGDKGKGKFNYDYSVETDLNVPLKIEVPMFFIPFGKGAAWGFKTSAIYNREKIKFRDDYVYDADFNNPIMQAKLNSWGVKIYPFTLRDGMDIGYPIKEGANIEGNISTKRLIYESDYKKVYEIENKRVNYFASPSDLNFILRCMTAIYFQRGITTMRTREPNLPNGTVSALFSGWGTSPPLLQGKKLSLYVDFSIMKYRWNDAAGKTNFVRSVQAGFGLGINIYSRNKKKAS